MRRADRLQLSLRRRRSIVAAGFQVEITSDSVVKTGISVSGQPFKSPGGTSSGAPGPGF